MASTLPKLPIFEAIAKHDPKTPAIIHSSSQRTFTYGSLLHDVAAAKDHLSEATNGKPLRGERIAFLAENGYDYVGAILQRTEHSTALNIFYSDVSFHSCT
jgi:malonyl-CoA/methylmalonyl-CoA synthetase